MSIDIFSIFGGSASGNSLMPHRDPGSVTGTDFIKNNIKLKDSDREVNILNEFLHGNIPDFLRKFTPLTAYNNKDSITYLVMTDYLSIGNDSDYVRIPMNPHTAQTIADQYDCTLPTRKMVNDIWKASVNKLAPLPWGPPYNSDMQSTHRFGAHNKWIQNQLTNKDIFALTSGHKKDVVLTNKLYPKNPKKRVAIYGWTQLNGKVIQDLNPSTHEDTYSDYSHGIRLCANDVMVNGKPMRIKNVFADFKLAPLVSDEAALLFTRY